MPELPEVETVRRGLEPLLAGRLLARVEQRRADLRFPLPHDFAGRLRGRRVTAVARRAKFLLFRLDDGMVWLAHLGMSGCFRVEAQGPAAAADGNAPAVHDHLLLTTDDGVRIRFCDPRRFGFMDLVRSDTLQAHPMLAKLGPEPLGPAFTASHLARGLGRRAAPLKAALLDQRVVAGLGNIYASESLYRARLSPERPAATVARGALKRLAASIRSVLSDAIAAGGASLRDHRAPSGELGCFQHAFAVYGRAGQACPGCRCDLDRTGGVRRIVQAGRSTYYCPTYQR